MSKYIFSLIVVILFFLNIEARILTKSAFGKSSGKGKSSLEQITVFVGPDAGTNEVPTPYNGKTKTGGKGGKNGGKNGTEEPTGTEDPSPSPTGTNTRTGTKTATYGACSSTDFTTIQEAVDFAAIYNGTVQFVIKVCAGQYDGAFINTSNIYIQNAQRQLPVITNATYNNPWNSFAWTSGFYVAQVDNVKIEGFEIVCSVPDARTSSVLAEGVVVVNSTNWKVQNNFISDCRYGVLAYGGSKGKIYKNTISGVDSTELLGGFGIALHGFRNESLSATLVDSNVVTSNSPDFNADPIILGSFPWNRNGDIRGNTIRNNRFIWENAPNFGVDLFAHRLGTGMVLSNKFQGNFLNRIYFTVAGAMGNEFERNDVNCRHDADIDSGFEISRTAEISIGNKVVGNSVKDCELYGIHLYWAASKNIVERNHIHKEGICAVKDEGTDDVVHLNGKKCPKNTPSTAPFTRTRHVDIENEY